jgi:hypothetical protein
MRAGVLELQNLLQTGQVRILRFWRFKGISGRGRHHRTVDGCSILALRIYSRVAPQDQPQQATHTPARPLHLRGAAPPYGRCCDWCFAHSRAPGWVVPPRSVPASHVTHPGVMGIGWLDRSAAI